MELVGKQVDELKDVRRRRSARAVPRPGGGAVELVGEKGDNDVRRPRAAGHSRRHGGPQLGEGVEKWPLGELSWR